MKISIISIGKLDKDYELLANKYVKMICAKLTIHELTYSKKIPASNIKQFEAELITKKLTAGAKLIVLDETGRGFTSHKFSDFLESVKMQGVAIDFVIGGAYGLAHEILVKAYLVMRLSEMTLPHQMAKTLLLEQLYRAETIVSGHPYHK